MISTSKISGNEKVRSGSLSLRQSLVSELSNIGGGLFLADRDEIYVISSVVRFAIEIFNLLFIKVRLYQGKNS